MDLVLNTEAKAEATTAAEESRGLAVCAQALVINNAEQYEEAADILKEIKGRQKQLESRRKWFTEPLLEMKRRTDVLFKTPIHSLKAAEDSIKRAMLDFTKRAEEERKRLEAQAQRLAADENASVSEVREVLVQAVTQTETPKVAGVVTKTVTKFEIEDAGKLPREYLKPDDKEIRKAVKAGKAIPGIRVWEEQQLSAGSK